MHGAAGHDAGAKGGPSPQTPHPVKRDRKLVVVGLDGATWRVLDPLIDAGRLPNIARIAKDGCRATLRTIQPPISCPAWFCYSTGKNPGKLGIYGWRNFDPATKRDWFNDYKSMTEPEIWDYLGRSGLRSLVVNIPTHFPPKHIHGYMVSGMQAEEHQPYTFPPELKAELKERFGYHVSPRTKMLWDYDACYREILELFPLRFRVVEHLLDKVDFAHTTVFHIDEIQHNAWGTEDLFKAWERLDAHIGEFLARHADLDVLFMSDHGFTERSFAFNINHWLEAEGYLVRKANPVGQGLLKAGVTRQRLERVLRRYGLLNTAKRLTPKWLQESVKEESGQTSHQRRLREIDWDRTKAFASTNYSLHVIDPDVEDEILQKLRDLRHPETNDPFFDSVVRASEVLHGPKMAAAPQILYVPADGNSVGDGLGRSNIWGRAKPTAGGHSMDGIFMAIGPSFRSGVDLGEASLLDLAPTVLHAYGLPVPTDMDGRVLDIFAEKANVAFTKDEAEAAAFTQEELEKVEERLRGLGYIE